MSQHIQKISDLIKKKAAVVEAMPTHTVLEGILKDEVASLVECYEHLLMCYRTLASGVEKVNEALVETYGEDDEFGLFGGTPWANR